MNQRRAFNKKTYIPMLFENKYIIQCKKFEVIVVVRK